MSGNDSDKNNNAEVEIKYGNMTTDSDIKNNRMTHDHEAFVHQIRLFLDKPARNYNPFIRERRFGLRQEIKYLQKENMILFM